ncbi:MAG: TonB-dependent receptor [Campylobacteraceae bacterium]|nr:TonB-dependent receptor [Campylobacteraceae bacterium]
MYKKSLSAVAALFLVSSAFAEERVSLDTIEVSSTISGAETVDAYKVRVRNATLTKDILRDIPGVYMSGTNGYNQKIFMRGMSDRAINVTIDGARQRGNTFHHAADLLLDPAIIKAVDVGVGVHSVVGTSGAMGGSVAFKTVDASDLLEHGETIGAKLRMGYASNNDQFSQGVTVYGSDEDRVFDFLGYFSHSGYDFGEDGKGREIGGEGDDYNYLLKLGANIGDYSRLWASYEHMEHKGLYPFRPEWPGNLDKLGKRDLRDSKYTRDTYTLGYTYNPNNYIDLELSGYFTDHNLDQTKADPTGIDTGVETWGIKVLNKTKFDTGAVNHTLVYGAEYYQTSAYNDSKHTSGKPMYCPHPKFCPPGMPRNATWNNIGVGDDKVKSYSVFLEDQIRYGGLTIVPGIRFDYYKLDTLGGKGSTYTAGKSNLDGDPFGRSEYSWNEWSPALLIDYQTEFGLGMHASYARLFRGPDVYEAIRLNDANAMEQGHINLKAETGDSYELGLRYGTQIGENSHLNLSAKYFYVDYYDLIGESSSSLHGLATRINTGDAEVDGFELAARLSLGNLSLGASYSKQDIEYKYSQAAKTAGGAGLGVYGSTLAYSNVGDKYTLNAEYFIDSLDMFLGWNMIAYDGIRETNFDGQELKKTGYAVHDIYATWAPDSGKFKGLEVNFGIYNIFDKTYASHNQRTNAFTSDTFRMDWEEGRNVKLTASYKF